MKKNLVLILTILMCMAFAACDKGTPQEQLAAFIDKNGADANGTMTYEYAAGTEYLQANDEIITEDLDSDQITCEEGCKFYIKDGAPYVYIYDQEKATNGLVMARVVQINLADGKGTYINSLNSNGTEFGGMIDFTITPASYTEDTMPEVSQFKFATTNTLTADMKEPMKEYVAVAMECFNLLLTEELGLEMADFGYEAY